MGDGEGEGKVGEGKRMIALANSCEARERIPAGDEIPQGDNGFPRGV